MRTPEQILGPYFPMGISPVTSGDLTSIGRDAGRALGELVEIGGQVLNLESEPVRGARILVWQANCFGRYAHPNDPNREQRHGLSFPIAPHGGESSSLQWRISPQTGNARLITERTVDLRIP
jgi:protocatechuate 3,4-dioxygenase beta subunit